jgi:nicotinamidase-related amidase
MSEMSISMKTSQNIDRERTALVFVEFQHPWVSPHGRLRTLLVKDQPQFQQAIDNSGRILTAARRKGWQIAHAPLDFRSDPKYQLFGSVADSMGLRQAIQEAQTWIGTDAEFVPPFEPRDNEFVAKGRSGASVLTNSTLDAFLRNNDINCVVFLGFATHVCIESSLRQAHDLGYKAFVVADAVGAFEDQQNAYFQKHVLHHFGASLAADHLIGVIEAN